MQNFEGKEVFQTISLPEYKRSNNQNAYMWSVVYKRISDYTGYSEEEVHDLLRLKFWYKFFGDEKIPDSTQNMNTAQMEEYLSNCRMWASIELNEYIPLPNEVELDK